MSQNSYQQLSTWEAPQGPCPPPTGLASKKKRQKKRFLALLVPKPDESRPVGCNVALFFLTLQGGGLYKRF